MADASNRDVAEPALRRLRELEATVLGFVVEHALDPVSEAAVVEEMSIADKTPVRADAVRHAVEGLAEVALLERRGDELVPTPAARRVGEMRLGL